MSTQPVSASVDKDGALEQLVFSLKSPLVSEGHSSILLKETDLLRLSVTVYAAGGENYLHTHPNEDHAFIVMDGEATFHGKGSKDVVLRKWQGIMLQAGVYYRFTNTGSGPLVMLRSGAAKTGEKRSERKFAPGAADTRIVEDVGEVKGVHFITKGTRLTPGKFFADPDAP